MTPGTFEIVFNHGELQQLLFLPEKPFQIIFKYRLKEIVLRKKGDKDGLFELDSENSDYFSSYENNFEIPSTACPRTVNKSESEELVKSKDVTNGDSTSEIPKKFHNHCTSHSAKSIVVSTLSNSNRFSHQLLTSSQKDIKAAYFQNSSSCTSKSDPALGDKFSCSDKAGKILVLSNKSIANSADVLPAKRLKIDQSGNPSVADSGQQNKSVCFIVPPSNCPEYFIIQDGNVIIPVIQNNTVSIDGQSAELPSEPVHISSQTNTDSQSGFFSIQKTVPATVDSNYGTNAFSIDTVSVEDSSTVDQEKVTENPAFSNDSNSYPGDEVDFDYDSAGSDNQVMETFEQSEDVFWKKKCAICLCPRTSLRFLHKFPKDPACSYRWAEITRRMFIKRALCSERTEKYRICSDHFQVTDYDQENYCLLSQAVPSVSLRKSQNVLTPATNEVSSLLDGEEWPDMCSDEEDEEFMSKPKQSCKCAVCFRVKTNRRMVFHRFPQDPVLSEKWAKVCDRNWITKASPKERHSKLRICMEHFRPSDHFKSYRLVPDAVPSKIPPRPKPIVLSKTDDQIILSNGIIYERASSTVEPSSSSKTIELSEFPSSNDKSFALSLKEKLRSALNKNLNKETNAQISSQEPTVPRLANDLPELHTGHLNKVDTKGSVTENSEVHSSTS